MHMEQIYNQTMKITSNLEYIELYTIMVAIYCYLEGGNHKVLKFNISDPSSFEISGSFF